MAGMTDQDYRAIALGYRFKYANSDNLVGKPYWAFTSNDLAKVDDQNILNLRGMMIAEKYEHIDTLLPRSMSRAELAVAVLRESVRRNLITLPYDKYPDQNPAIQNRQIEVLRTQIGVENPKIGPVRESVATIALRDGVISILARKNALGMMLDADVAQKSGIGREGRLYPINTDTEAYDLGYTAGSMQRFRVDDPLRIVLTLSTDEDQSVVLEAEKEKRVARAKERATAQNRTPTRQELAAIDDDIRTIGRALIQRAYCSKMDAVYEPGDPAGSPEELVRLGFIQARVDRSKAAANSNDRIGIYEDCPSKAQRR